VPALRRAPGARSLSAVFYGRLAMTAVIKSVSNGTELSLAPAPARRTKDGYYMASLRGPDLSASLEVYDLDVAQVARFFGELGQNWRTGWSGEKAYMSLEGHLELKATRDKLGHVFLRVVLHDQLSRGDWIAGVTLELEAGQLPQLAAMVQRSFGSP
jgi:hypothetical protein